MIISSDVVETVSPGLTNKAYPCWCGLIWFRDLAGNRFHWVYISGLDRDWAGSYTQFAKRVEDKQYCRCGKELDDVV